MIGSTSSLSDNKRKYKKVNMKKLSLLIILFTFVFLISFQIVSAQEQNSSSSALPTPTPEYQLPYPGLLPDNPLYFLKMGRDKVMGFLISDPLKKAEFNLLQADKRLNAGVLLAKKTGKENLAISTLSKGENYFEEAIAKIREAKKQGMEISEISRKLFLSNKKHQEVIKEIAKKISPSNRQGINYLQQRMSNFEKEVNSLVSK